LNPGSRSAVLAGHAYEALKQRTPGAELVDLRDVPLPMCDGGAAYKDANLAPLAERISAAGPIILAVPVYNYDVNAAAKNMIELTGRAWTNKVVGFICAAGGQGSFMSVMSLANSLMLDFRCLIVPRFVYTTDRDFDDKGQAGESILVRTHELCEEAAELADAVGQIRGG